MWDEEHSMRDAGPGARGGARSRAAVLAVGLLVAGTVAAARPSQDAGEKPAAELVPRGLPVGAEARKDLLQRVLAHPGVALRAPGHRLAGIRLTVGTANDTSGPPRAIATVVLFDHTAGAARRVLFDVVSGDVLANTRLPGRPQGSREEFEEAAEIVRREPGLARLLDEGGVLDGGFIVDDPAGSRRRMMQLKLLSADRRTLLRSITVDLTRGAIAIPRAGR
jgi:hypothetical protein